MEPDNKALLRHMYAAIAMHAMILADAANEFERSDPVTATPAIASNAFAMADAMIEKGGPIE